MLDSFFTLFQTDALSFVLSIALSIITTTFVLHRCTDPRSSSPAAALANVTSSPTKKDIPPPAREMREMAIQAGDGDMTMEDMLRTQLEEEKKNHDLDKEAAMSREEILRAHLELEKMFHEEVAIERQETLAREEEYRSALLEAREQTESMVQELVDLTAELEEANRQDAELEAKFRQGAWVHPAVAEKDRLRRELSMATAAAVEGRNKESGYKSKILDLESRLSMASSEIESLRFQLGLQTTHVESLQKHLKSVTAEREVRTPSPPPSALRLPPPTPPMTPSDSQVLTLVKRPTITTLGLSSMHFRSPSWPMPSIPCSPILSPRLSVRPFFVPEGERLDAEDEADGWDCVD